MRKLQNANMQHELAFFCELWPGLQDILPQLKFCMESFYVDGKRYYGLLKTTRDINRWGTTITERTSKIWQRMRMCSDNVDIFIENYIRPMCYYLNAEQGAMFRHQFKTYVATCMQLSMSAYQCCPACAFSERKPLPATQTCLLTPKWTSPPPTYSKEINELFEDDPLDAYNKSSANKSFMGQVDLCDEPTICALFVPDVEPSTDTKNNTLARLPSLSLYDYTFPNNNTTPYFDSTQNDDIVELSPNIY